MLDSVILVKVDVCSLLRYGTSAHYCDDVVVKIAIFLSSRDTLVYLLLCVGNWDTSSVTSMLDSVILVKVDVCSLLR